MCPPLLLRSFTNAFLFHQLLYVFTSCCRMSEFNLWLEKDSQADFFFPWQRREYHASRVLDDPKDDWIIKKMKELMSRYDHNEPLTECTAFLLCLIGRRLNLLLKQCWKVAMARCDQKIRTDPGYRVIITYNDLLFVMSKNSQQFAEKLAKNKLEHLVNSLSHADLQNSIDEMSTMVTKESLIKCRESLNDEPFLRYLGSPPLEGLVYKILDALAQKMVSESTELAAELRIYEVVMGYQYQSGESDLWTDLDEGWIEIRHYEHAFQMNESCSFAHLMGVIAEAPSAPTPTTRKRRSKTTGKTKRRNIQKMKRSGVARI